MPRLSARSHLLIQIAAAVIPVWLFAAYLLGQYALNERQRFERDALQVARQVSLVVEAELGSLLTVLRGLSTSTELATGDLGALHSEAKQLAEAGGVVILLRDLERRQLFNTQLPYGGDLPPAVPLAERDLARLRQDQPAVGNVYKSPVSGEYRIPVALPVRGPRGESWLLAITAPTSRIRDVMLPAVPDGWTIGVGDHDGAYVARSKLHEEMTGQPGLPEYLEKVVGRSGTFTSRNFQGMVLLAGYYRPEFSGWFYSANIPLSVVQAPLWRSLRAIGAIGLVAMLVSLALAYVVGKGFARAARDLAGRADALGRGQPVAPVATAVSEFNLIGDALVAAERALKDRAHELEAVLETVPAAVWFTYDPAARQVIRNRFAAALMGLPADERKPFGEAETVIDTIAVKDGRTVSRDERPLSRAMRGELTDNEEFSYVLPSGVERHLLTSARPIADDGGRVIGAVQISLDITERKRGEEQRKLLVNELNHRVKNTLAVVQSVAAQTLRNSTSLEEAKASLTSRLVSLAKAHDILTQEHWSGADLNELVLASVAAHAPIERFDVSGPPLWLSPTLALSLAMAIHELATNAIKYGALSVGSGRVAIAWTARPAPEGSRLAFEWQERGGPVVEPASRRGFGTRMIERLLDSEPGGEVRITFEPEGLVCRLEVDLPPRSARPAA